MKIAITADPELPVPPVYYGGIERIIDMLAEGLVQRGHEVSLFAHPDSQTVGKLFPWRGRSSSSRIDTARNAATLWSEVRSGKYDLVHSFSRIASLMPILPLQTPKLMTYQRAVTRRTVKMGHALSRHSLSFSAISHWMMKGVEDVGNWYMVPNGVPLEKFDFCESTSPDSPLVFLGRIEEIKGPHRAIEIAKRSNNRLIIAGNIPTGEQAWFDQHVKPHVDGAQIQYVGPVDDVQKNKLLGESKAFLMAISWDEPFGIVMAEALACGTPVIGTRRGAVPEVVEHGKSGYVVDTLDELVAAVERVQELDRRACRKRAETMYSASAVVEGYLSVYRDLLHRKNVA